MKIPRALLVLILMLSAQVAVWAEETLEVEELVKTSQSWDGSALVAYPEGTPEVTILKITIPPKFKLPTHRHPMINAGGLLSGELTVTTIEGKTLHMTAGDPIVEVVNKWHHGVNEGDTPAVIIVVYAGAQGLPLSVKQE